MRNTYRINDREVGGKSSCYIIAEAGSNHNKDINLAFKLIDIAKKSGADAVKFQTFSAETIASQYLSEYTKIDFAGAKSLFELYKNIELPREWQKELCDYSRDKGITFLSTPFDEKAVDELEVLGIGAYKIASFELNHFPLLRHAANTGKPVILSTGMATIGEIEEAVNVIVDGGGKDIGLFHCGIGYPMNPDEVNLRAMNTMMKVFGCPVGYSDHTMGISVPVTAVALGAKMIEKHFTSSRTLPGPDHGFALEPGELEQMVLSIRTAERCLGTEVKGPTQSELDHKKRGCRSIHARSFIKKGAVIKEEMLIVLRPSAGLHPRHLEMVTGLKAVRDINAMEPLGWDCITSR